MENLEELLAKFWAGNASEKEKEELFRHLGDDQAFLERMRDAYENDMAADRRYLSPAASEAILQKIRERTTGKAKGYEETVQVCANRGKYRLLIRWAAAAAVVIAMVAGHYIFGHREQDVVAGIAAEKAAPVFYRVKNNEDSSLVIGMADGSQLKLSPGAVISYSDSFNRAQRNIELEGTAIFAVAKNAALPFKVTANGITTTALGTRFTIAAGMRDTVRVVLHEGKVVIHAASTATALDPVYLNPGQELLAGWAQGKWLVRETVNGAEKTPGRKLLEPAPSREYHFKKEPLAAVYNRLSLDFSVPIRYEEKDVKGLFFTGTFSRTDDLDAVMNMISRLHDFSHEKSGGGYTVFRK